ncbi:hypothetical protein ACFL1U_03470 [Patescibacteria group bacterium]
MPPLKILIVEDEFAPRMVWKEELEAAKLIVLQADCLKDARELFKSNPDISAIIMDMNIGMFACEQTDKLVKEFRETFSGPIVAASCDFDSNALLIAAGCDYKVADGKFDASQIVLEVLGLKSS